MNSSGFKGLDLQRRATWDELKQDLDSVRTDICTIKRIPVLETLKEPILAELEKQANEVKEKMHDYIDSL